MEKRATRRQDPALESHSRKNRRAGRSGVNVRRSGKTDPRIQAATPECASYCGFVFSAEAKSGFENSAANVPVRWQGGAGLLHGEAHDQDDHISWRDTDQ